MLIPSSAMWVSDKWAQLVEGPLRWVALDALRRFGDLYETGAIPEYQHTVDRAVRCLSNVAVSSAIASFPGLV